MAIPDYFHKSAIAAAQVFAGFDEEAIRGRLESQTVGVLLGAEATSTREGRAIADLLIRLFARIYPSLSIRSTQEVGYLADLALAINPQIEVRDEVPDLAVCVGQNAPSGSRRTFYAGSSGWNALFSSLEPVQIADSVNPFGAGFAACIAAANVFRIAMLGNEASVDTSLSMSTFNFHTNASNSGPEVGELHLDDAPVLVGLGAIGNGAAWALGKCPIEGVIHLVDPQSVELSNLQRYVLTERSFEGRDKVEILEPHFQGPLRAITHKEDWTSFVQANGYEWNRVLVALDSAKDRRAVQSTLPRWIANGWTQPGDLGVSVHPRFTDSGACLRCLYLPKGPVPSEDRIIARALGLGEHHELAIRHALHGNAPLPEPLLVESAAHLNLPMDDLKRFADRPVRELYSEGICGGVLLSLDKIGAPSQEVHVPLAHQSALAGVILAGRLVVDLLGGTPATTHATRVDVLRPIPAMTTLPLAKDERGICICQDHVYCKSYEAKYESG